MKNTGAVVAVVGFALWFGGEFIGFPGLVGLGLFIVGATIYFVGRKGEKAASQEK
jgi:hypothetical protein